MTIVPDNEHIQKKRTIIYQNDVLMNNFEENIKFQTNEESDQKCKFNSVCFCHVCNHFFSSFVLSIFFSFSTINTIKIRATMPYDIVPISTDSYIILRPFSITSYENI
jgi:hypothetical protein